MKISCGYQLIKGSPHGELHCLAPSLANCVLHVVEIDSLLGAAGRRKGGLETKRYVLVA